MFVHSSMEGQNLFLDELFAKTRKFFEESSISESNLEGLHEKYVILDDLVLFTLGASQTPLSPQEGFICLHRGMLQSGVLRHSAGSAGAEWVQDGDHHSD